MTRPHLQTILYHVGKHVAFGRANSLCKDLQLKLLNGRFLGDLLGFFYVS